MPESTEFDGASNPGTSVTRTPLAIIEYPASRSVTEPILQSDRQDPKLTGQLALSRLEWVGSGNRTLPHKPRWRHF